MVENQVPSTKYQKSKSVHANNHLEICIWLMTKALRESRKDFRTSHPPEIQPDPQ